MVSSAVSDLDADLARIDADLREPARDPAGLALHAGRLYQRAALTGSSTDLLKAEALVERALAVALERSDLYLLKANLDFAFHRLADVRADLEASPALRASPDGRALAADLAFQEGRFPDARRGYEETLIADRAWEHLCRLAHLEGVLGETARADALYEEAGEALTAKEMRAFAWVEIQRGLLHLKRGRLDRARAHYARAEAAYTGYWIVDDHMAELLAAEGDVEGALRAYRALARRVDRPEMWQTLGELCTFAGIDDEAELALTRARDAYLASVGRGEVRYYHHLADFLADVRPDPEQAVIFAAKDLELRENPWTLTALAWALHRAGRSVEGATLARKALESDVVDAHLFHRAGTILAAAGFRDRAVELLARARDWNPRLGAFHVHR